MQAGIERIWITDTVSGSGAWRFYQSQRRWQATNNLYRSVFGMTLLPDAVVHECAADQFEAGYDKFLGIDVILNFSSGMSSTVQEKCLLTDYKTVTVEYMQDWRQEIKGDWFHMKAQYYVVAYDREHRSCPVSFVHLKAERDSGICHVCEGPFTFQDWIVLDWPQTQRNTAQGNILWRQPRPNARDGARSNFKWATFTAFPENCVVASSASLAQGF